jgi:hypothetical protein
MHLSGVPPEDFGIHCDSEHSNAFHALMPRVTPLLFVVVVVDVCVCVCVRGVEKSARRTRFEGTQKCKYTRARHARAHTSTQALAHTKIHARFIRTHTLRHDAH